MDSDAEFLRLVSDLCDKSLGSAIKAEEAIAKLRKAFDGGSGVAGYCLSIILSEGFMAGTDETRTYAYLVTSVLDIRIRWDGIGACPGGADL